MKFRYYSFKLAGIMILVFLAQVIFKEYGFTEFFVLNGAALENLQVWRFFSSIFLHGGLGHLAYNLFALVLFGSILETLIGGKKFLWVFFIMGVLANIVSVNFYSSSLGASGAIFGVIGALVFVKPMQVVWAFGLPMPIFIAGILWGIGDVMGAIGFLVGNPISNTGNIEHLSGMFFGLLFGAMFKKKRVRKSKNKFVIDESSVRKWERGWLD